MARIAQHIRAIDMRAEPGMGVSSAPPKPDSDRLDAATDDGGLVPWLWIAAWLLGWAIFVALAAYWVGAEGVRARDIWIWIGVWAVGGLAVAGLLVRMAAQSTERAFTLRRLTSARQEIAQLEAQLLRSTQSLFTATQTLTEATDLLLEQVDTSRDDLRNQIRSAQDLADSLRTQTEGLVSARSRFTEEVRGDVIPAPVATPAATEAADMPKRISVRPADTEDTPAQPEASDAPAHKLPPLGLRPAPDVEESFLPAEPQTGPDEALSITSPSDAPDAPIEAVAGSGTWEWKDMLSSVDAAVPPEDDTDSVVADLRAAGLSPEAIVDDGNAVDALNTWDAAGLPAMGQLLSIRFDEPARAFRDVVRADREMEARMRRFSDARASKLAGVTRAEREADAATEAGRAWLFVQAVLAL